MSKPKRKGKGPRFQHIKDIPSGIIVGTAADKRKRREDKYV